MLTYNPHNASLALKERSKYINGSTVLVNSMPFRVYKRKRTENNKKKTSLKLRREVSQIRRFRFSKFETKMSP